MKKQQNLFILIASVATIVLSFITILSIIVLFKLSIEKSNYIPIKKQINEKKEINKDESGPTVEVNMEYPTKAIILNQGDMINNKNNIYFLENGDIWIMNIEMETKNKLVDQEKNILNFQISPDGQNLYWTDGLAIWKRDYQSNIKKLTNSNQIKSKDSDGNPLSGGISNFIVSPNGQYIAYEEITGYTTCCLGPPPYIPVFKIMILKNDGTEKNKVPDIKNSVGDLMRMSSWTPSNNLLFYFKAPDGATQGSYFYQIDPSGNNLQLYNDIYKYSYNGEDIDPHNIDYFKDIDQSFDVLYGLPIYSPKNNRVAMFDVFTGNLYLKNLDNQEIKELYSDDRFYPIPGYDFKWSNDGNYLYLNEGGIIYIYNKDGDQINKIETSKSRISEFLISPDRTYLIMTFYEEDDKYDDFLIVNLSTTEKKIMRAFNPFYKNDEIKRHIDLKFILNNKIYYYVRNMKESESGVLYALDMNKWENSKISETITDIRVNENL